MKLFSTKLTILTALLASVLSTQCYAQDNAPEELPWYQVEVIIFGYLDPNDPEKHRSDIELNYPDNWVKLSNTPEASAAPETLPISDELPYTFLPDNLRQLNPDSQHLKQAQGYQVMYHAAWRQPGFDRDNSPWVLIQGGKQFDDHYELEGSLRLVRNRYLHVQANLWKSQFVRKIDPLSVITSDPVLSDMPNGSYSGSFNGVLLQDMLPDIPQQPEDLTTEDNSSENTESPLPLANSPLTTLATQQLEIKPENYQATEIVTLNQSTRILRDEVTYLDHPEMGVLVLVNRYEPPSTDSDTP